MQVPTTSDGCAHVSDGFSYHLKSFLERLNIPFPVTLLTHVPLLSRHPTPREGESFCPPERGGSLWVRTGRAAGGKAVLPPVPRQLIRSDCIRNHTGQQRGCCWWAGSWWEPL